MRVERGEFLMALIADIKPRWTPGNEHLWDEYDPESLLDTPEKQRYVVNALLFGRLTVYRALRAGGQECGGAIHSSSGIRFRKLWRNCGRDSRGSSRIGRDPA